MVYIKGRVYNQIGTMISPIIILLTRIAERNKQRLCQYSYRKTINKHKRK